MGMLQAVPPVVESPCIQVCTLDENDMCKGCFRTKNEIMLWTRMTHDGQREILRRCRERAAAVAPN
jgi:predicted Fe-S protein YdhL (DUF1289 family)